MENIILTVDAKSALQRVDKYISEQISITRNAVQKLIEKNYILVNNSTIKSNYKVKENDIISVTLPDPEEVEIKAEDIPLDIVYEDDWLLVVNKPKGMVVHPATGNYTGTLVNALMHHCKDSLSGINGEIRPGIVHRIDKNTSGLLIVAKNDTAHLGLAEQIKEHSFTREYEAVVHGRFKQESGTIDFPIGRHPVDRKKMAVTYSNSRNAITHYHVIAEYGNYTHIRLRLETGRTHQIRVHMAHIGHPVAGDDVYMTRQIDKELCGQCLHAKKIGFVHPKDGKYLEFESDLPDYFKKFLNKISKMC
ncbi:MAG: RluA family pseudouridine synthase [Clostridia bacterium]|nr:RluA family pseudouridine synthase [Clostridia bacterium]